MSDARVERLKSEIETVDKEFQKAKMLYRRYRNTDESIESIEKLKEEFDYLEGVVEGLGTALKIMQGEIS